jgi:transposase InsO family protein
MSIEEKDPEDKAVTVRALCLRAGLSRQAFYKGEKERQRHEVDAQAVAELVKAERKLQPCIGTRKLHVMVAPVLEEMGIVVGRDRMFEILREKDLLIERQPARAQTTDSRHFFHKWPNLLRQIEPTMAHQVWVGDLTYVRTCEGFLYLSLLTDGYSRKIIGYHANDTLEAEGCLKTLKMAINQLPDGAAPIHHTDCGIQYCCKDYIELLQQRQIAISMTEMNHCYENAKAERVNGILKGEYGLGCTFRSKKMALKAIDQAIALYNGRRPHQALGYQVPNVVHAKAA